MPATVRGAQREEEQIPALPLKERCGDLRNGSGRREEVVAQRHQRRVTFLSVVFLGQGRRAKFPLQPAHQVLAVGLDGLRIP